ncbi:hypothetical protein V8F20_011478 [Naviculisporaceae sp. PSN 640]
MPAWTFDQLLANISKAEWTINEEQFRDRSPWYDVQALLPQPPATPFPIFKDLPADLVVEITRFMPKESVAALALTCKALRDLLGNRAVHGLTGQEKWRLLLLLERDTPDQMACTICTKLHNVWVNCDWRMFSPCIPLPYRLTYPFCRRIMRQYLHRQPYDDLLSLKNTCKIVVFPDVKASKCADLKIVDGHLLVKTEFILAPFSNNVARKEESKKDEGIKWRTRKRKREEQPAPKTISGRAADALNQVTGSCPQQYVWPKGADRFSLDYVQDDFFCPHQTSDDVGISFPSPIEDKRFPFQGYEAESPRWYINKFLTDYKEHQIDDLGRDLGPGPCFGPSLVSPWLLRSYLTPTLTCALFHDQPCSSSEEGEDSCKAGSVLGKIRSCAQCFADMCISAKNVEGIGRVMIMTSWQDLGGVTADMGLKTFFARRRNGILWNADGGDGVRDEHRHRLAGFGTVMHRFEGLSPPLPPTGAYIRDDDDVCQAWIHRWIHRRPPALLDSKYMYEPEIRAKILQEFLDPKSYRPGRILTTTWRRGLMCRRRCAGNRAICRECEARY